MIPNTGTGLLIVLLFLLPGSVFQFTRSRLRGPTPDDANTSNRVLRALSVSAVLTALYAGTPGRACVARVRDTRAARYRRLAGADSAAGTLGACPAFRVTESFTVLTA